MNRISATLLLYIWISWSSTAIAQATLASLWAEQVPRFSVFQADGEMKRLVVGDNDEPFCVESDFHFERDHDKFFAEFTTRSKSPGVAKSLVPDRTTIVCDGETIWTCLFLKNHSKGGVIRIYAANSGEAYLSETYHVWLDLREVHGAFFSERLAEAVGKPLQELPKSIVLPKNQGIECVLMLDERNYPQMTVSRYEGRGLSAKTTVKYLFDRSTNLPQYRNAT